MAQYTIKKVLKTNEFMNLSEEFTVFFVNYPPTKFIKNTSTKTIVYADNLNRPAETYIADAINKLSNE